MRLTDPFYKLGLLLILASLLILPVLRAAQ